MTEEMHETVHAGLSPRRRGNRQRAGGAGVAVGPIPAKAGEPVRQRYPAPQVRAYPREGGGTHWVSRNMVPRKGLSPRRRGNLI